MGTLKGRMALAGKYRRLYFYGGAKTIQECMMTFDKLGGES